MRSLSVTILCPLMTRIWRHRHSRMEVLQIIQTSQLFTLLSNDARIGNDMSQYLFHLQTYAHVSRTLHEEREKQWQEGQEDLGREKA